MVSQGVGKGKAFSDTKSFSSPMPHVGAKRLEVMELRTARGRRLWGWGWAVELNFALLSWFVFSPPWSRVRPPQLLFLFLALIAKLLPVCPENIDLGAST